MNIVRDDDDRKIAQVSNDGHRLFVQGFAPAGYNGQSCCWLLTPESGQRWIDAMQGEVDAISKQRTAESGQSSFMQ